MRRTVVMLLTALAAIACGPTTVRAQQSPPPAPPPTFDTSGDAEFDHWRADFAARAVAAGHNADVVHTLLSGITPDPHIIDLDQRQPEFVAPVWSYVTAGVTDTRVAAGVQLKNDLGATLPAIAQRYGVDGDIVLGIWGLESNFGQAALAYRAPTALSTLAFEGRRRAQFENYLLALMQMVERGLATPDELASSWAGALGQPQFMPDIYLSIAQDYDGDGKRDIWGDKADIAASIANYLHDRGWQAGQPVFDEVRLPAGFDFGLADGTARLVSDWDARGVKKIDGTPWNAADLALNSQLYLPAGATGPALLLHPNFAVIRRYNNSDRYALVVSLLARGFAGRPGLVTPWPTNLTALNRDQIFELQTLLNAVGVASGEPDGQFGSGTRRAVREYQRSHSMAADGFPTLTLLNAIRTQAGISVEPEQTQADPDTDRAPTPRPLHASGIRELQRLLKHLGYYNGATNGNITARFRTSIRSFQRRHHMSITGRATTDVLEAARHAHR